MKTIVAIFICIAFFLAQAPVFAAVNFAEDKSGDASHSIEPASGKLRVGERLEFDVYWMGLHIGLGTLEVNEIASRNGRPAYHVIAVARTNDTLSKIYPLHDEIHSYIDTEGFYSHEFSKSLKEGRYRADERVLFDHDKQMGFYESFLNKNKREFKIPPRAQDFLSLFYWFRVQPIEVGQSVRAVLSDKGKDYDVQLEVLRKVKKELRGGRVVWTVEVEPRTHYQEVLYRRGRGWVNFTTEGERIPVFIRISTPFGPVMGVLKNV